MRRHRTGQFSSEMNSDHQNGNIDASSGQKGRAGIGMIVLIIGFVMVIVGIITAISAQGIDTNTTEDSEVFGEREDTDIDKVGEQYFLIFTGTGLIFFGIFVCAMSARFFMGPLGRGFLMNARGPPGFGMHHRTRSGYREYGGYRGYGGYQNKLTVDVVKIKCRNCGYLESEDADFCRKCGEHL